MAETSSTDPFADGAALAPDDDAAADVATDIATAAGANDAPPLPEPEPEQKPGREAAPELEPAAPEQPWAPASTVEERAAARSGHGLEVALGVIRAGVGAALVAAPGWAGRIWVGPGADGPGSKVFARALGARDVVLGARILLGVQRGEPVGHWIGAGFAADAADVAATVVAGRHLTPARRAAMPLVAGAVGVAGVLAGRRATATS